jgi:hypothetical protein
MKVFWSYAKRDDPTPHNVSNLKKSFETVLGQCIGDDVELFQDTSGLKWGVDWRKKLEQEVLSSNAFVCVLSPSYFNSKMCIQELVWAISNNVSIYPILYRKCPKGLQSSFSEDSDSHAEELNRESKKVAKYQYVDFDKLRNKPKDGSEVLDFLDNLCEQIA